MNENTTTLGALFADYKENEELALLPPGEYEVEVVSIKLRDTDIIPTYRVVSGPYAGKRILAGVLSWRGNARGRFFSNMARFGLGEEFFTGSPSSDDLKRALEGRVVVIAVLHEEPNAYHDDTRMKLEKVVRLVTAPAGSGTVSGIPRVPTVPLAPQPVPQPAPQPPSVVPQPAPQLPSVVPQPVPQPAPQPPSVVPQPVPQPAPQPVPQPVLETPGSITVDDEPGF